MIIVTVYASKEISIPLTENPTTGYRWEIDYLEGLELVKNYFAPDWPFAPPGTGGTRWFVFKADETGNYLVNCKLRRPWEKDKEPVKTQQILLKVKTL